MPPAWGGDGDRHGEEDRPSEAPGMEMSHARPVCSPSHGAKLVLGGPLLSCISF